jgi:proteinaceous RNase P
MPPGGLARPKLESSKPPQHHCLGSRLLPMRRAPPTLLRGLTLFAAAAASSPSSRVAGIAPRALARAPSQTFRPVTTTSFPPARGALLRASATRSTDSPAAGKRRTSSSSSSSGSGNSGTTRRKQQQREPMDGGGGGAAAAAVGAAAAGPAAAANGAAADGAAKRARSPAAAPAPAAPESDGGGGKRPKSSSGGGGGGRKQGRPDAEQRQAAARVFGACKQGDAALALARFGEFEAAGYRADGHLYNTMIHVCAGLWDWETIARARASERAKKQEGGGRGGEEGGRKSGGVRGEAFFGGDLPIVPLIRVHHYEGVAAGGGGGGGGQQQQPQQQQQPPPQQPQQQQQPSADELAARADEFWRRMQAEGFPAEESTYTHLARIAAMRGDADAALAHARTVADSHRAAIARAAGNGGGGGSGNGSGRPMIARLRTYQPALLAFALRGDALAVRDIDSELQALNIDLTEGELALLLEAAGRGGDAALAAEALHRMTHELARLAEPSVEVARRFFLSPAASGSDALVVASDPTVAAASDAAAGGGGGAAAAATPQQSQKRPSRWVVERTRDVDPVTGSCPAAGGPARLVDLSESDWDAFAEAVRRLAVKSAKTPDAFERFVEWEARHGPFERCVDAANVALFGQNYAGGAFRMEQVRRVHAALGAADAASVGGGAAAAADNNPSSSSSSSSPRTLVVLHTRRKGEPSARQRDNAAWLESLARGKRFWWAAPGSNDDWYWLYASVRARGKGLLVTNDEMRDHVFQLLRPKHFLKWKERHVVRYDFGGAGAAEAPGGPATGGAPRLFFPRPFTSCVQRVDATGAWMIPVAAVTTMGGGGGGGGSAAGNGGGGEDDGGGCNDEAVAAEAAAGGAGEWLVARPVYE